MYFTETDCETPEVASFSTGGWDEILDHPGAAFSEDVAANFGTCGFGNMLSCHESLMSQIFSTLSRSMTALVYTHSSHLLPIISRV
jgi:hypothetical protein